MAARAGCTDLLIVTLLLLIGSLIVHWQNMKSAEAIATLIGALIGGGTLLLGKWINRWNEHRKATKTWKSRYPSSKQSLPQS